MGALFPGSALNSDQFTLSFRELTPGQATTLGEIKVEPFAMNHLDAAGPCLGVRVEAEGRMIAFSGDTEWTEALIPLGRDADLFICEAYTREKPTKLHLALAQLEARLPEIRPKRLVLTHMSEEMLARRHEVPFQTAEDGMVIEI
jgi:ribonuclease BN (tRNA processing enzyme)